MQLTTASNPPRNVAAKNNKFESVVESIKAARVLLTPVKEENTELPKWLGAAPVEVKSNESGVTVEMARGVKPEERRFLKENGFRAAENERTWIKEDGTQAAELAAQTKEILAQEAETTAPVTYNTSAVMERAMSKGSANEVFAEFAKETAALKVAEAFGALESGDRQRAQETILGYALGKPVERTISLHANIANMSKEELLDQIRQKLDRLGPQVGIEGTTRGHSLLLNDSGGSERRESLKGVQAESGVPGAVPQE